jgi:predicted Zn-ribbon and HTH transcriptional regulator
MSKKRETDNEGDAAPLEKKPKQQEAEAEPAADKAVDVVVDAKIQALEEAYRLALTAFKVDKTNKDLRRARSAAKRAWDEAVVASTTGGEPLTCKDCSHMFLFLEKELFDEKGWMSPSRCPKCHELFLERSKDRTKLDSKGKNMCYDFQRGECTHGNRCRFSHDPKHAGSASKIPVKPVCFAFKRGHCKLGDECRFRHEVEETGNKNKETTTVEETGNENKEITTSE